ncbi:MAG: hypothetical protein ACLP01_29515 [Solirubrobacteraceae bacterium]
MVVGDIVSLVWVTVVCAGVVSVFVWLTVVVCGGAVVVAVLLTVAVGGGRVVVALDVGESSLVVSVSCFVVEVAFGCDPGFSV